MKLTKYFRIKSGINVRIPAIRMWPISVFLFCRTRSGTVVDREAVIGSTNLPYVVERGKISTPLRRTELCPSICKLVVDNRARNIKSKIKNMHLWYSYRAPIIKIQENTNKCITVYYKDFIIYNKLHHVSTFCGSPSGNVH